MALPFNFGRGSFGTRKSVLRMKSTATALFCSGMKLCSSPENIGVIPREMAHGG
jgi:hypothetical protein